MVLILLLSYQEACGRVLASLLGPSSHCALEVQIHYQLWLSAPQMLQDGSEDAHACHTGANSETLPSCLDDQGAWTTHNLPADCLFDDSELQVLSSFVDFEPLFD